MDIRHADPGGLRQRLSQVLAARPLLRGLLRALGAGGFCFVLAGAGLLDGPVPLALAPVCVLPFGPAAICAYLGAAAGYALLCEPAMAAERIALTALLLAAIVVFQGTALPATRWFLPVMSAGTALVLGSLQVFGGNGGWRPALQWLTVSAAAGVGTAVLRCGTGAGERGRPLYFAALLRGLSGLTALRSARPHRLPPGVDRLQKLGLSPAGKMIRQVVGTRSAPASHRRKGVLNRISSIVIAALPAARGIVTAPADLRAGGTEHTRRIPLPHQRLVLRLAAAVQRHTLDVAEKCPVLADCRLLAAVCADQA